MSAARAKYFQSGTRIVTMIDGQVVRVRDLGVRGRGLMRLPTRFEEQALAWREERNGILAALREGWRRDHSEPSGGAETMPHPTEEDQ